ncbi:aminotransferase class V-fold PLP-dependent enzyme [Haematomicrobium sanguinis]|uniref:aminotransferase class V-fold PLP-dependent enzyme n=1 Tax=Haematomicrobium sanguinis TaxID=479106 RepID=UPI00047A54B1|nr:aminotransferase class V-fold PLP-dependent enzyme [Haematomicrobium sanguinis]
MTATLPGETLAETTTIQALLPVVGGDLETPLLDGNTVPYANLDYAASAPILESVQKRLAEVTPYYASVHRGAGYASQVSTSLYEGTRIAARRFLNAPEDAQVIVTRNTTDALNLLASAVPEGTEVLYLDLEHHANLLPWQARAHRSVLSAPTLEQTLANVEAALTEGSVSLVAITGASNVTGEILPLARFAAIAHRHGARLAVDAAQLAPHRRIDMVGAGIDYLALSGHKLYAPFGAGLLVGPADWLDAAPPYLAGGGAVVRVKPDSVTWAVSPARHEAGSPNVLGAATLTAAIEAIEALDPHAWHAHEEALRARLIDGLNAIAGVQIHRIFEDSIDAIGVVNFSVKGYDGGLVAAFLSAEFGVGLRDGKFCAHPLLNKLGLPSGALRASFGLGSTSAHVDRLVTGVTALVERGLRFDYVVDEGRWVPAQDTREFPAWAPNRPGTAGAAPCSSD